MAKTVQSAEGVDVPEFRFKTNYRFQGTQKPALAGNPEFFGKVAFDAGYDFKIVFVHGNGDYSNPLSRPFTA